MAKAEKEPCCIAYATIQRRTCTERKPKHVCGVIAGRAVAVEREHVATTAYPKGRKIRNNTIADPFRAALV